MPLQFNEEYGGKLLAIRVSGKLPKTDHGQLVPEFERAVRLHEKMRVLFDIAGFHGWDAGAAWEDFKFGIEHLADIERLAMVGESRWQQGMALFCRPITRATVRYFDQANAAEARSWLAEA